MNSLPPAFTSASFNSNAFSASKYVTRADADRLYLPMSTGAVLSYLTGITPGTAAASRALVLDSSSNINGINVLGATQINITRNGSQLSIINGGNSGLIEVPSSPNHLRLVRGYAVCVGASGVTIDNASNLAARYPIDLQATLGDIKLCLYQSGSNGTYGLGASGSALNYCSGGTGHKFYKSSTAGVLSTLQAEIDTSSNFIASNNLISGAGAFLRQGFSTAGRTGTGLAMHMANANFAEIFSYDYPSGPFKDINIANTLLVQGGTQCMGIGFNPASDVIAYPFAVNKTISSSIPGSYGYLSTGGAGTGSGTGSVQVSMYASGRVFAVEFDAYSDRRLKHKIAQIDQDKAMSFIDKVEPVEYEWRSEDAGTRTGYVAQQLLSTGLFPDLVTMHKDSNMKADDDSPEGYSLSLQYANVVPILHSAIRTLRDEITSLREELAAVTGASTPPKKPKKPKSVL